MGMRNFYIKDLAKLKEILEDPRVWEYYRWFTGGGKIVKVKLAMYRHPDGAVIAGKQGRWWVYLHTEYVLSERDKEPLMYDIALWKLKNTPLLSNLIRAGVLEIKPEEEHESVSA